MSAPEAPPEEIAEKDRRIRAYLAAHDLDAALLSTPAHFSWATAGGSNTPGPDTARTVASLLYTPAEKLLLCEDGFDVAPTFQVVTYLWYAPDLAGLTHRLVSGRIGADTTLPGMEPLSPGFDALRWPLTPSEVARLRELGIRLGIAMTHACYEARPGLSEQRIAAILAGDLYAFGILPILLQVATDDHTAHCSLHPTERRLERLAMLTVTGRMAGLTASLTRLVHFGEIPTDLRRRHEALARIDAALIAATRPGAPVGGIFRTGLDAYACAGYPDEWRRHPLGGRLGHNGPEHVTPDSPDAVHPLQPFAWHPTLGGLRSEDTLLATEDGPEVLTLTPDLPSIDIDRRDAFVTRPDILSREQV